MEHLKHHESLSRMAFRTKTSQLARSGTKNPKLPLDPEAELQGYADRLDQEVQDLNVMRDEAAGMGDEVEAERIGQMIRNLERLLLHLPRPRRLR